MKISLYSLLFLFFIASPFKKAMADHVQGAEITYKCTSTPGVFEVTFILYRDCSGIPVCGGGCGASCTRTLNIMGADPSCSTSSFGSITLSLANVTDADPNPICPNSKSICDNTGCTTPGTYTPGMERYEFKGLANIGPTSGIPASCCNIRFVFDECCRSAQINTGATWANFYIDARVNRCASTSPCNSSPVFTGDPSVSICGGQNFIYNMGAVDPDHDSLTFAFAPAAAGFNTSSPIGPIAVPYDPPFSYDKPMPWSGAATGTFPAGIHCDPNTGDIMFTPPNASSMDFYGVVCVEVKQWKIVNGVLTVIGITRRDITMRVMANCTPNNIPRFNTIPPLGANPDAPKLDWEICVGEQLCFDITAKDTDQTDTTYLSWNGDQALNGATFTANYTDSTRDSIGPREDSYKFCWTPGQASNIPYAFTVMAKDNRCPNAGKQIRAFSVKVLSKPNLTINKTYSGCGNVLLGYTKNLGSLTPSSVTWQISSQPYDYAFAQSPINYTNVQTLPSLHFSQPGLYLVKLEAGSGSCTKVMYDTLQIDSSLSISLPDTFACFRDTITIAPTILNGNGPFNYKWYKSAANIGALPLNTPTFSNPSLKVSSDTSRQYVVVVKDNSGCSVTDSLWLTIRPSIVKTTLTNVSCNGGATGSIVFKQQDSTALYEYRLNGGPAQFSPSFTNLAAGTYSVVAYGLGGCTRTFNNLIITEPFLLLDSATTTKDEICYDHNNGSITAVIKGGVAPFSYKIDSAVIYTSTNVFNGLKPGIHTIYIKDAKGCLLNFNKTIGKADTFTTSVTKTNVNCFNANNGLVSITPSGGKAPYLYRMEIGGAVFNSNNTFSNLAAGAYVFSIVDNNNCLQIIEETITQPAQLVQSSTQKNIACFNDNNGEVTITATGGVAPYTYQIDTSVFDTASIRKNLTPGPHSFTVKDQNGCIVSFSKTITQPTLLQKTVNKLDPTCHNRSDGRFVITASGGKAPYQYQLNSGAFVTNNTFNALPGATYNLTVKDDAGCILTFTDSILNPQVIVAGAVTGDITTFKNTLHIYEVTPQVGMSYLWSADKGTLMNGQSTSAAEIRWDSVGTGSIKVVVYKDPTCRDSSNLTVTIGNTGLNELAEQLGLEVFPNPTKNILNITLKKYLPLDQTITLYDMQGKVVLEQPLKTQQQLNLENLPQGIYMLKIADWRGSVVKQ
jgi:hypothetical protein